MTFKNEDSDKIGFLGYEIYKKEPGSNDFEFLDFTYGQFYQDKTNYEIDAEVPQYAAIGFDRLCQFTKDKKPKGEYIFNKVCRVQSSNVEYDLVTQCIANSQQIDTIILLSEKIYENNIILNGNKDITFTCSLLRCEFIRAIDSAPIMRVIENAKLTIEDGKIVFNGNKNSLANAPLLSLEGNKQITLKNIEFKDNKSSKDGGAIVILCNCNVILDNIKMTNNHAKTGGGIFCDKGSITITNSNFSNNVATEGGGVIRDSKNINVFNNTFFNNSASNGGVIQTFYGPKINFTDNKFINNKANNGGVFSLN